MRNKKFKYQTYLKKNQDNIKHIILTQKAEFHSRLNHFWDIGISTLITLPYFVIALLLYLVYEYSNITIIQVICMVAVFLLIPLGYVAKEHFKSTIEDYIFDEFIFPQIEQKYLHEDSKKK
jgi:hypothetical protein